jgi:hypothetical protein
VARQLGASRDFLPELDFVAERAADAGSILSPLAVAGPNLENFERSPSGRSACGVLQRRESPA